MTREEIIDTLKTTALEEPEAGWLSGLSSSQLAYSYFDDAILINGGDDGAIDLGHLADIIEGMIQ